MPANSNVHAYRVIVIDSNYDQVRITARMLEAMGHRADFAITGHAGLDIAVSFGADVMLVDLELSDIDGATLARRIRKQPGLKAVRVFGMTGSTRQEDWQHALEAGCEQVLIKPVDPKFLQELLASL